ACQCSLLPRDGNAGWICRSRTHAALACRTADHSRTVAGLSSGARWYRPSGRELGKVERHSVSESTTKIRSSASGIRVAGLQVLRPQDIEVLTSRRHRDRLQAGNVLE